MIQICGIRIVCANSIQMASADSEYGIEQRRTRSRSLWNDKRKVPEGIAEIKLEGRRQLGFQVAGQTCP